MLANYNDNVSIWKYWAITKWINIKMTDDFGEMGFFVCLTRFVCKRDTLNLCVYFPIINDMGFVFKNILLFMDGSKRNREQREIHVIVWLCQSNNKQIKVAMDKIWPVYPFEQMDLLKFGHGNVIEFRDLNASISNLCLSLSGLWATDYNRIKCQSSFIFELSQSYIFDSIRIKRIFCSLSVSHFHDLLIEIYRIFIGFFRFSSECLILSSRLPKLRIK